MTISHGIKPRRFDHKTLIDASIYNLRRGTSSDVSDITRLVRMAYSKWVEIIGRNPLPMDVDYNEAIKHHRFDLLLKDSVLTGVLETYEAYDCLFIENLCISPNAQRQGLGQRLLTLADDIAIEAGFNCIRLDTNKSFAGNVALYTRTGYITEWEKPIIGGIHVRMYKRLG